MSTLTAPAPRVREPSHRRSDARRVHRLGQYASPDGGQTREIVSLRRPDGSTLVIDRLASTLADARLVAQLRARGAGGERHTSSPRSTSPTRRGAAAGG